MTRPAEATLTKKICHSPFWHHSPATTMEVGPVALLLHLLHGDSIGSCANDCRATPSLCTDGLLCTEDVCNEDGSCANPPVACAEGEFCEATTGICEAPPPTRDENCVSGKVACTDRHAAELLGCYADAQRNGTTVDAACVTDADAALQACFVEYEENQDPGRPETLCRTVGDETALTEMVNELTAAGACAADPLRCPTGTCTHSPCETGAALTAACNPCVARICEQAPYAGCCTGSWDESCTDAVDKLCGGACETASAEGSSECAAGKTECLGVRLSGLLGCYAAAQRAGEPLDPACVQSVVAAFDGCYADVDDPSCLATFDGPTSAEYAGYAADSLACELDVDACPCCNGECVGKTLDRPTYAKWDLERGVVCGDTFSLKTHATTDCTACPLCESGEICVDGECRAELHDPYCKALEPLPNCSNSTCSFLIPPSNLVGGHAGLEYRFVEVTTFKDTPVYFHVRGDGMVGVGNDDGAGRAHTPTVFACAPGKGTFRKMGIFWPTECALGQCYDQNGNVTNLPLLDELLVAPFNCKDFVHGPVTNLFSSTTTQGQGNYVKFIPNPGETGMDYSYMAILFDDSSQRTPPERPDPYQTLWIRFHVLDRTEPTPNPLPTGGAGNVVLRAENGHFYELVTTKLRPDRAKLRAEKYTFDGRAGHLVTIDSAEENEFVRALAAERGGLVSEVLIGLTDEQAEGTFSWMNGEPLSYDAWGAGQPDDPNGDDDSVVMSVSSGAWRDIATTGNAARYHYVVEYE